MAEQVILVDEHDNAIGLMEKMEAHRLAKLHRAFSVFAMNDKNEILLQRRALHKYHSGGLWTNTCCSHPRDGENVEEAAKRRLMEEMGFTCDVKRIFSFIYKAELDNDLTEHELDHVLIARWNDDPNVNPDEVADVGQFPLQVRMGFADLLQESRDGGSLWQGHFQGRGANIIFQ